MNKTGVITWKIKGNWFKKLIIDEKSGQIIVPKQQRLSPHRGPLRSKSCSPQPNHIWGHRHDQPWGWLVLSSFYRTFKWSKGWGLVTFSLFSFEQRPAWLEPVSLFFVPHWKTYFNFLGGITALAVDFTIGSLRSNISSTFVVIFVNLSLLDTKKNEFTLIRNGKLSYWRSKDIFF